MPSKPSASAVRARRTNIAGSLAKPSGYPSPSYALCSATEKRIRGLGPAGEADGQRAHLRLEALEGRSDLGEPRRARRERAPDAVDQALRVALQGRRVDRRDGAPRHDDLAVDDDGVDGVTQLGG